MEISVIAGYTANEKVEIAHKQLIPTRSPSTAWIPRWSIDDDAAALEIRLYTRERACVSFESSSFQHFVPASGEESDELQKKS